MFVLFLVYWDYLENIYIPTPSPMRCNPFLKLSSLRNGRRKPLCRFLNHWEVSNRQNAALQKLILHFLYKAKFRNIHLFCGVPMDRYSLLKTCFRKGLYNLFHSKGQTASYIHSLTSPMKSPHTGRGKRVSKLQAVGCFFFLVFFSQIYLWNKMCCLRSFRPSSIFANILNANQMICILNSQWLHFYQLSLARLRLIYAEAVPVTISIRRTSLHL